MMTLSPPYADTDRDRARSLLGDFVFREEFHSLREEAFEAFSMGRVDELPAEERKEYLESGVFERNLGDFVALGYLGDDGRTLLDRFLAERGGELGPGERGYLEDLRKTRIGFYEVQEAAPGVGLRVEDLWSGESHWVQDASASRILVRWDLFAARLLTWRDGETRLESDFYPFPHHAREVFLAIVQRARRDFRRFGRGVAPHEFLRGIAALVHRAWLETVLFQLPLEMVTYEGDEVVLARTYYEIRDREALVRALDARADFEREGNAKWTWRAESSEGCRCALGILTIEADRLVAETHSRERDARLRDVLEAAAGDAIRRGTSRVEALRAPPGDRCVRDEDLRIWTEHVSPALGGRTPRQAARTRKGRRQLVEILKSFENHEARAALAGQEPHDFGWLWKELGLERPLRSSSA